eukprot:299605_1
MSNSRMSTNTSALPNRPKDHPDWFKCAHPELENDESALFDHRIVPNHAPLTVTEIDFNAGLHGQIPKFHADPHVNELNIDGCYSSRKSLFKAQFRSQINRMGRKFVMCKICCVPLPKIDIQKHEEKSKLHEKIMALKDSEICENFNNGGVCSGEGGRCDKLHVCSLCRCTLCCRLHCFSG